MLLLLVRLALFCRLRSPQLRFEQADELASPHCGCELVVTKALVVRLKLLNEQALLGRCRPLARPRREVRLVGVALDLGGE
jgi:hypothetical protein